MEGKRMGARKGPSLKALERKREELRLAEEERKRIEEENQRIREEEEERQRQEQAKKEEPSKPSKSKKQLSRAQQEKLERARKRLEQLGLYHQTKQEKGMRGSMVQQSFLKPGKAAESKSESIPSPQDNTPRLCSPICCVLGHVDTGKTKLLDKMRSTSVQKGEAGGITQQIGATWFPIEFIKEQTKRDQEYNLPGLLIIDTPGHESFNNLRSRGSSLCNIAILIVDIMHGLEPQTLESIGLLKAKKTPFVVALNKIDRIYKWTCDRNCETFADSYASQSKDARSEFDRRLVQIKTQFAEQGLNTELFHLNKSPRTVVSLVPTSAISGEGIGDLLDLLVRLTQTRMAKALAYSQDVECTVLEVKVIEGLGTTIDVVLSNGELKENDRIVVCGFQGPITTTIRALLTPQPLKELRVKSAYVHHKIVRAAMGVKISGPDLEGAVAGGKLVVLKPGEDEAEARKMVMEDLTNILESIDKGNRGVTVQASTLGSLEALLSFLKTSQIPVGAVGIGPVFKRDVIKTSIMFEHAPEYAAMLCFDVRIEKEAQDLASELGIRIFQADIIYHLYDQFKQYIQDLTAKKKQEATPHAVFPCILKILPQYVFNTADPIVCGVEVVEGIVKMGTPLCIPGKGCLGLGRVMGIKLNDKPVLSAKRGDPPVSIKIEAERGSSKTYGRHFDATDQIVSKLTRASIDALKDGFRDEMTAEHWNLVRKLKPVFGIL